MNFVLNDPFGLGLPTLDATGAVSATCSTFDSVALRHNIFYFVLLWWAPHSILARRVTKQALGTWGSALDRPLFALMAPFGWLATLLLWEPIDTCARFSIFTNVDVVRYALHAAGMIDTYFDTVRVDILICVVRHAYSFRAGQY